jgi:tRNA threonylcarbamoyladenosine biosynthesis protein TsaE
VQPHRSGTGARVTAPPPDRGLSLEELQRWGEAFGRAATAPLVVALSGDLGAGKTTLIQAICRGYGVSADVTSPTFALVHEYPSNRGPVFHLDLYRLRGPADLTNIAWDDIVNADALVLIEWAERAAERLPADAARILLAEDPADGSRRRIRVG